MRYHHVYFLPPGAQLIALVNHLRERWPNLTFNSRESRGGGRQQVIVEGTISDPEKKIISEPAIAFVAGWESRSASAG